MPILRPSSPFLMRRYQAQPPDAPFQASAAAKDIRRRFAASPSRDRMPAQPGQRSDSSLSATLFRRPSFCAFRHDAAICICRERLFAPPPPARSEEAAIAAIRRPFAQLQPPAVQRSCCLRPLADAIEKR